MLKKYNLNPIAFPHINSKQLTKNPSNSLTNPNKITLSKTSNKSKNYIKNNNNQNLLNKN